MAPLTIVFIFFVAPFILAMIISLRSYKIDGVNKTSKIVQKHNNLVYLAKSPVILFRLPFIHHYLSKKFPYYQDLPADDKHKFALRVSGFIATTNFNGMEGFTVTEEVKCYISACAVQLTFGLEGYLLENIHFVQIFPSKHYSRLSRAYHKGEYRKNGILRFSWKDFNKGYDHPTSGVNLGLHEMAHALEIGMLENECTDEFFENYYARWKAAMKDTYEAMSLRGEQTILRQYAASNEHEFFAVCIEHFFERPQEFKEHLPHLYDVLAILLNQDPLRKNISPRITEIPELENTNFIEENEKILTNFSYSRFLRLIVRLDLSVPLAIVLYAFYNNISDLNFVLMVWAVLLLLSSGIIFRSALINVCDKGLSFTNPFRLKKKTKFSFKNIVKVSDNISLTGKKSLEVFYTNKGKFAKKKFYLPSSYSEIKKVLSLLKEHKIHIHEKA